MPKPKLNLSEEERKEHFKKYGEKWRANNKDKIKAYYEEYKERLANGEIPEEEILKKKKKRKENAKKNSDRERLENPSKYLYRSTKARAVMKGLEFNLDIEDIVIPTHCPVLGIEISLSNRGIKDNSPSLDRIDSSKGYVKGNVMVMSYLANAMKRTADSETLLKFADWIYSTFKFEK